MQATSSRCSSPEPCWSASSGPRRTSSSPSPPSGPSRAGQPRPRSRFPPPACPGVRRSPGRPCSTECWSCSSGPWQPGARRCRRCRLGTVRGASRRARGPKCSRHCCTSEGKKQSCLNSIKFGISQNSRATSMDQKYANLQVATKRGSTIERKKRDFFTFLKSCHVITFFIWNTTIGLSKMATSLFRFG